MKQTDFKPDKPATKAERSLSPAAWHNKATKLGQPYNPTYVSTEISITWYGRVDSSTVRKYLICFQWGDEVKVFDGVVWESVIADAEYFLTTHKTIKND